MSARPFSPKEIKTLEARLRKQRRWRDLMLLLVGTNVGYRISELLTLKIGQVCMAKGEISREVTVTRALLKGGKGQRKRTVRSRRVVLNDPARAAIRRYLDKLGYEPPPEEYLFLSRQGGNRPIDRSRVHRILVGLCRACRLDHTRVSTHSFRKTFVRSVYDASGHDLVVTSRIVQHSNPVITARYLDTAASDLDAVVLSLAAAR